jgi:hypothetical protein
MTRQATLRGAVKVRGSEQARIEAMREVLA